MDRLHVATLNILNLADRWDERLPLLLADFAALQPDLIGLQEVVYPMQQDRLIGAGRGRGVPGDPGLGGPAGVRQLDARRGPGSSPRRADRLDLGLQRAAHRVRLALPGGARVRSSRSPTSITRSRPTPSATARPRR